MAGYGIRVGVSGMTGSFMFFGGNSRRRAFRCTPALDISGLCGVGHFAAPRHGHTGAPWRWVLDSRLRACHTPPRHHRGRYRFLWRFRMPLLRSPFGLGAPLSQRGMGLVRITGRLTRAGRAQGVAPTLLSPGTHRGALARRVRHIPFNVALNPH